MKNIKKDYYGNQVLKGVDLKIKPGEIHAIVGENGAGKSTLMNILFGMRVIHDTGGFEGEVYIDGKQVHQKGATDVMNLGVGMVHQELMLIKDFSATENIKLNREKTRPNFLGKIFKNPDFEFLDKKIMGEEAKAAIENVGLNIDEDTLIKVLPIGHKQFLEIAREIDKKGIKLLVFDEPTAVLTESEAADLLTTMKKLSSTGIGILFITHRLDEVVSVTDNLTVIRDGEHVDTLKTSDVTVEDIAALMVGREISIQNKDMGQEDKFANAEDVLKIENFYVDMPGEEVKGIDIEIKKGEIFGFAGLAGHGKIGVANGILGLYPAKGNVIFEGEPLKLGDTKDTLKRGVAYVSEDRKGVGLLLNDSIENNIVLTSMQIKNGFLRGIWANGAAIRKHANDMIKQLDIRCTGPTQHTRRLSGGNQQKVCLARALTLKPKLLFVSEPTRGIDIGAKKLVLDYLVKLANENNTTVIVTSSELAELRSVCDRIAIITEGKLEGILKPDAPDVDFGLMMSGDYKKNKKKGNK
ncbi:MAG: sugar ABC transporter ATP-binding protein [Treponema sp.]|nr:MAG: sugar ABC transporter ATP-binding protein [Treponema sp.]